MAKTVAELVVNLSAETAKFRRDMNQAAATSQQIGRQISGHVGNMKRSFDNLTAGVKGFAAAYIGLRGAQVLVSAIRDAVAFGAAIDDAARRIGVTTDTLQELRFAAEQAGGTVEGLDSGLEQFTRRLGEAANGTGQLGAALAQYNIAVTGADGQTRSVDAVLRDYADAIAAAGSETEQMRLTTAGFGRGGTALVGVLREGSAGFDRMADAAHDAGAVMESDVIAAAAAADDRLAQLSTTLSVQLNTALINLAPIIETVGGWLVWLAQRASDAISLIEQATDLTTMVGMTALRLPVNLNVPIAGMGDEVRQEQLAMFNRAQDEVEAELAAVLSAIDDNSSAATRERADIEIAGLDARRLELEAARADFIATLEIFDALPELETPPPPPPPPGGGGGSSRAANNNDRDVIGAFITDTNQRIALLDTERLSFNESAAAQEAARMQMDLYNSVLEENQRRQTEHNEAIAAGRDSTLELIDLRALDSQSVQQMITDYQAARQAIDDLKEAEKLAAEAAEETKQMMEDFGNVATNALAAATAEGANFRDVLLGIISDLLQMASVQEWIGSLFSGGGGFGGGGGDGFAQRQSGGSSGGGDGFAQRQSGGSSGGGLFDWIGGLLGLAEGGPVAPGLTYLVGEKGPELFTSSRGGQIIPNDALGGGGGLTVINNIDARQTDIGVEMRIRAAMAETERRIFAAINRGGQESKITGRRPA